MAEAARSRPILSVVDYAAWERGYMPPSEHVLIDQLAYRGARVKFASDWGKDGAIWVVMRGDRKWSREVRKKILEMADLFFQDLGDATTGEVPQKLSDGTVEESELAVRHTLDTDGNQAP